MLTKFFSLFYCQTSDNMGSDELIANLFRISQTEQRLRKDNINTEKDACDTHYKIA